MSEAPGLQAESRSRGVSIISYYVLYVYLTFLNYVLQTATYSLYDKNDFYEFDVNNVTFGHRTDIKEIHCLMSDNHRPGDEDKYSISGGSAEIMKRK